MQKKAMDMDIEIDIYNSKNVSESGNIIDLINWLQIKCAEIPEQYKHTARYELIAFNSWSDMEIHIRLYYNRPETEAEKYNREIIIEHNVKMQQVRDLAILKELKSKYPDV